MVIIGFLLRDLIYAWAAQRFMSIFFKARKISFNLMVLLYFIFFVIANVMQPNFIEWIYSHSYLATLLFQFFFIVLFTFLLALTYEGSLIKKLVATAYICVIFTVILWTTIGITYALFFVNHPTISFINWNTEILILLTASIASYLLAILLSRFEKINKNNAVIPKIWLLIIAVQILMVFLIAYVMAVWEHLGFHFIFVVLAILLATNIFILYLYNSFSETYEEKLNVTLQTKEKAYYLSQLQLIQKSDDHMKSFKHDIKNHLAVLKAYALQDDSEKVINYADQLLGIVGEGELHSDTGNIAIDSIINYKLLDAAQEGIKLDINLLVPANLQIEETDTITLLGNLLDNALEAIEKVNNKWIKLDIEFSRGILFIKVENSFNGDVSYSIDKDHIVTSKNGDGHGYGLKNITQSISKYDGEMKVFYTKDVFSVVIFLYINA